ncbi:MAG: polysaccharide biosynthesis C-terminal domain-containing protein, partial [Oscillospiraceae bacterium]|nr:polysaccharide biosynthesis C-terminal domain-containing protein [Oscillospiraceae bacterium]
MVSNGQKNENIALTLVKFCTPLILTGILQQIYNWADAFIVGNVIGEKALAAVGAVSSVSNFYIMAITGFTTGIAILIAQKFGSGETEQVSRILSTFVIVLGAAVTIISVVAFFAAKPLLTVMDTPSDIFDWSKTYLQIITIGVPFLAMYNLYAATLRSVGDSRAPFFAVLVSSVVNVILDIIFVALFNWGVAGAAFATIIAQAAMTAFIIIYGIRKHEII